nr:hypothetical protein [uncultured Roseateles sp.]
MIRTIATLAAVLSLAVSPAQAQSRHGGFHHGGGFHGGGSGIFWGGVGIAIGLGLADRYYYPPPYYPYYGPPVYPSYAIAPLPPIVYSQAPMPAAPTATAPDPIFYPRNGQSPEQIEADRQACNRWATTQPKAMADASVFQRATLACMDGRGYTSR